MKIERIYIILNKVSDEGDCPGSTKITFRGEIKWLI